MDKIRAALDVTTPRHWQSAPDHPPTHLAYISDPEHALLKHLDMHKSGVDREDHWGPNGVPSLDGNFGGDSSSSDYGGGWSGGSGDGSNAGSSDSSSSSSSSDSGGGWGGSGGSWGGDTGSNWGGGDGSSWGSGAGSWGGDNSGLGSGWSDNSGQSTYGGWGGAGDSWSGSNPGMMGGDNGSSSFGMDNFGGGNITGGDQRSDPGMVGGGNSYISGGYPQGGPSTGPGTGAIGGSGQVFGTNYGPAQYTGQNPGTPNGGWVTPSNGLTSPDIPDPNAPTSMDSIISQAQNALFKAGLTNNANMGEPTYGTDSNPVSYAPDNPVNSGWVTPSVTNPNIGDLGPQFDPNTNMDSIISQAQQAMFNAGLTNNANLGDPTYGTDSNTVSYAPDNPLNSTPGYSVPAGYSGVDPANMFSAATSDVGAGINPADLGYTDPNQTAVDTGEPGYDTSGQPIGGPEYGTTPGININPTSDTPGVVTDATPVPEPSATPPADQGAAPWEDATVSALQKLAQWGRTATPGGLPTPPGGLGNKQNDFVMVKDPVTGKLVAVKRKPALAARGGTIDKALGLALHSSGDDAASAIRTALQHARGRPI